MAKIYQVKRARNPLTCGRCRVTVAKGEPYRWTKPRAGRWTTGAKLSRCMNPTCSFRPSEMTTSDKLGRIYASQEAYEDDTQSTDTSPSMFVESLNAMATELREVAQEYKDGASNIEEGFGHPTSQSEEMERNGENVEEWADSIEGAASEIESEQEEWDTLEAERETWEDTPDPQTCASCNNEIPKSEEWGENCPECDAQGGTQRFEELAEEMMNTANDAVNACPV